MKIIIFRDGARTYDMGGQVVMRRAAAARRVGVGMRHSLSLIFLIVCGTIAIHETAADDGVERCQRGDGVGGSEKKLSGSYSRQQCIEAVRSQFPKANGFTFGSWSSYGSCGTRCECYAEFDMASWDNKQTWESCKFKEGFSSLPISNFGCVKEGQAVGGSGFPNPSYNDLFSLSIRGNDLVLYNRHAVFENENGKCIWFANDRYWHMGNCNILGENSVYILKNRNLECPINDEYSSGTGSWFSGNRNLGESVYTSKYLFASDARDPGFYTSAASLTYQVRDGRYHQKCCWKKLNGNWLCQKRFC